MVSTTTREVSTVTQDQPVPVKRMGTADIVGFGQDGVVILRNTLRPEPRLVVRSFGYSAGAGGWRVDEDVRLVGDTTGNGRADIIGFGNAGVYVSRNNGDNTFGPPGLAIANHWGNNAQWNNARHIRYVADLRKKGMVDIIGFGGAGVFVSLNNGDGTFSPPQHVVTNFGCEAGGWNLEHHLRFLADTTGDGLLDIVGFGDSYVFVAINAGDGTFQPYQAVIEGPVAKTGWGNAKHIRTCADLTGDGRVDIIGFGDRAVYVSLNIGNGTFAPLELVIPDFGVDQGWTVENHPRFVADTTGDGCGDIVGFGGGGVYVSRNHGNGTFSSPELLLNDFGLDQGWRGDRHPRFLADLTGDGAADIIGFGEDSVWVSHNDGKGNYRPPVRLTDNFAFHNGRWALDKTVRFIANMF